jgi:hypothetical protein
MKGLEIQCSDCGCGDIEMVEEGFSRGKNQIDAGQKK